MTKTTVVDDKLLVLVPVDFSETSRRALAWAFDYAMRAPCQIHLLHVVDDQWLEMLRERLPDKVTKEMWAVERETEAELERMAPDPEARNTIGRIIRHIARGRPAAEILNVAEQIGADMIVMGTHGRSGLAHLLIGSVAEKVVRHANCPVVCVKPIAQEEARAAG